MTSATYDHLLLLKDAGAVTGDGAATVGGSARVIDVGPGRVDGKMVVDTSAIDTASGDEAYRVRLEGSNVVDFASGVVELASGVVSEAGRLEVPFSNVRGGTVYRYLRAYNDVGGTSPSINSTVFLAKP